VRGGRQLGRGGMQAGGDSRLDRGRARPSRVRRGTWCRAGPSCAGGVHAGACGSVRAGAPGSVNQFTGGSM
jgi:hypothetical protein